MRDYAGPVLREMPDETGIHARSSALDALIGAVPGGSTRRCGGSTRRLPTRGRSRGRAGTRGRAYQYVTDVQAGD